VVRAASQRLCPFQVDACRCIGVEIKPTNVRQDFLISMVNREFAKAASFVVDAEFKVVTWARLDEIVRGSNVLDAMMVKSRACTALDWYWR
jgi:hypothetical protein